MPTEIITLLEKRLTCKLVNYIIHTEVTSRGRAVIIDDQVSCIEFGIIYDEFYSIFSVSWGNVIIYYIFGATFYFKQNFSSVNSPRHSPYHFIIRFPWSWKYLGKIRYLPKIPFIQKSPMNTWMDQRLN